MKFARIWPIASILLFSGATVYFLFTNITIGALFVAGMGLFVKAAFDQIQTNKQKVLERRYAIYRELVERLGSIGNIDTFSEQEVSAFLNQSSPAVLQLVTFGSDQVVRSYSRLAAILINVSRGNSPNPKNTALAAIANFTLHMRNEINGTKSTISLDDLLKCFPSLFELEKSETSAQDNV